ncbi:hypothetical protein PG991_008861 [Apiospora marii]|uniref:Uncharacterized protein n=1 Tax=Apiospora marii TaxID=335849 RepID=A0ABR1RM16_9PEZI
MGSTPSVQISESGHANANRYEQGADDLCMPCSIRNASTVQTPSGGFRRNNALALREGFVAHVQDSTVYHAFDRELLGDTQGKAVSQNLLDHNENTVDGCQDKYAYDADPMFPIWLCGQKDKDQAANEPRYGCDTKIDS